MNEICYLIAEFAFGMCGIIGLLKLLIALIQSQIEFG